MQPRLWVTVTGCGLLAGGRGRAGRMLDVTTTQLSGEGEKPIAVLSLTFAVLYAVKENAPQTAV